MKELLFSITREDFDFGYFRAGGNGGQHRDKTSNACRCTHKASGAVATSQQFRSRIDNQSRAFRKCVESPVFQFWLRQRINQLINDSDILIEVRHNGEWVKDGK